jgi:hypothetical protein
MKSMMESKQQQFTILIWLVAGGLEHFLFSHILGIIIPTD